MGTDVVVLNGGSSSGKSSIARCLQTVLAPSWLTLGVDDLVEAMPPREAGQTSGVTFHPDGRVTVGPSFLHFESAWNAGMAAMARAGVGVIVDEVFLGGADSQARLSSALGGLAVLWVAVRCAPHVAGAREKTRPDRMAGMATSQAALVHDGVLYDLEVDTTTASAMECALDIAARVIS